MTTVLILGGTTEARTLVSLLAGDRGLRVVLSYAGRTRPWEHPGVQTRTGGFGGAAGLRAWLAANAPAVLVDATHPFAATISAHAAAAGVPVLRLTRPGWTARQADRWHRVPDLAAAADLVPSLGRRAFLATGRQRLEVFTAHPGCAALPLMLVRSVEPPAGTAPAQAPSASPAVPANVLAITGRGPFDVAGELALLREYAIDVLVARDSGAAAVRAKLDAAGELGVPVVMVDRPAAPGMPTVHTAADAAAWVRCRT